MLFSAADIVTQSGQIQSMCLFVVTGRLGFLCTNRDDALGLDKEEHRNETGLDAEEYKRALSQANVQRLSDQRRTRKSVSNNRSSKASTGSWRQSTASNFLLFPLGIPQEANAVRC